jgi:hypothetical protein
MRLFGLMLKARPLARRLVNTGYLQDAQQQLLPFPPNTINHAEKEGDIEIVRTSQ